MRVLAFSLIGWLAALTWAGGQSRTLFPGTLDQHPAIDYHGAALADPVSALQRDLTSGTATLAFDGRHGFLRSLLARLDVPVESQILVFSKTGIQHPFTTPENPRALYFNDRVIVGFIPGAPVIEVASHDPKQGIIFQTLKQDAAEKQFVRPDRCLTCHLSANSLGVPGILVRSMFTEVTGRTRPQLGSSIVDHRTPLAQRWGGWYVTGTHGSARHMGNAMVTQVMERGDEAITDQTLNRTTLIDRVSAAALPLPTSDIVALMVFDHQGHAMNLLTRLNWETRVAAADGVADFSKGELRELVHDLVDYFLFVDEPALPSPVKGVSAFADVFSAAGPRDKRGRSLRALDLQTRLFKNRCSYMVYSPAFHALPESSRRAVVARMRDVLLERGDTDVIEILADTLPGW
ncbi:MAG TPA: hypothetical protein VFV51_15055 [Vicinamibacterales bacterium]|nr:hypothetical protein [Vicinamibacterales bacterium]